MRIIIRHCSAWGNFTTHGLDIDAEADISILNKMLVEKFDIPEKSQILVLKRDGVTIKLLPGFPLNHYGVKDKSIVFLEKQEAQDEEEYVKQRSHTMKGDYFAKLGILTKVDEEEDDEDENGEFPRKKASTALSKFGSNPGSIGESNKDSDTLSETVLSSDDEHTPYKRSNGESKPEKKRITNKDEINRFIKEVKANSWTNMKEFFAFYEAAVDKESKIKALINEKGSAGWNSIHWSSYFGFIEILIELLKLGGDANLISEDEWTPLQLAAHKNHIEIAKILLNSEKIEIDRVTRRMTALHIAVKNGKSEMVALLLEKGADVRVKSEQGILAIDLVSNHQKIKEMIEYSAMRRAMLEFSPPKPPIVRGYMYKRGDFLYQMNKRFFVLNADEGTLIRYSKKEDCPNKPLEIIPLNSIEGVKRINSDKSWYYIQLMYQRRHILGCHNEEIANQWVTFIIQAAVYTNYLEENLQKEVKKSMAQKQGGNVAGCFGQITDEIELDDIPPKKNATQSQAAPLKNDQSKRATGSFQENTNGKNEKADEAILEGFDERVNFQSFKILKVLGSGAFGKVYKVKKRDDGKIYAMKALRKRNLILKNQLRYAVTEANVLKSTCHPFVLALHYAFQTPQYLYLILDYCPTGDLSLHLANKGMFTEEESKFYIAELILAVEHLHSKNIIYRDLKPENILTNSDGHIKLADFGLSKEGVKDNEVTKSFCGSPAYLSPEMLKNRGVGKPADIYGIGTVLYEMLTGESPFYSEDIPKMYHDIRKAQLVIPKTLSDEARNILLKLLDRDPMQRPGAKNKMDLRNHPFFAGLDWEKLERKEIDPPPLEALDEDEIEMPINTKHPFLDADYTEENKYANRVRQFTFVKST